MSALAAAAVSDSRWRLRSTAENFSGDCARTFSLSGAFSVAFLKMIGVFEVVAGLEGGGAGTAARAEEEGAFPLSARGSAPGSISQSLSIAGRGGGALCRHRRIGCGEDGGSAQWGATGGRRNFHPAADHVGNGHWGQGKIDGGVFDHGEANGGGYIDGNSGFGTRVGGGRKAQDVACRASDGGEASTIYMAGCAPRTTATHTRLPTRTNPQPSTRPTLVPHTGHHSDLEITWHHSALGTTCQDQGQGQGQGRVSLCPWLTMHIHPNNMVRAS